MSHLKVMLIQSYADKKLCWYKVMLIQSYADTTELCSVQFSGSWIPLLTITLIVHLHNKAAGHRSIYFGRLQLEHKVSALALDPTHCSRDKHFAWPHIHSFIHFAVCLTTGPKPLPKPALHIVRSRASYFKWEYPLLSLTL